MCLELLWSFSGVSGWPFACSELLRVLQRSESRLAASASWLGFPRALRAHSVSSGQQWAFQTCKLGGLGHPGVSGDTPGLFPSR